MTDNPHPETGITQETRESMYPETYSDKMGKVLNKLVEEMFFTPLVTRSLEQLDADHSILIDELELMYEAHMTVGGQQNRFNASVIRAAINVIKAL